MTGRCFVCGRLGPVVWDHPEGRWKGIPLVDRVVPLCRWHNTRKGRLDRAAGVEGGEPTLQLVLGRLAAAHAFWAMHGDSLLFTASMTSDTAGVLEKARLLTPSSIAWPMP